jgi:hypothetical protein
MNLSRCEIEDAIAILQESIKNRKIQMQTPQHQAGAFGMSYSYSEIFNKAQGSYLQMYQALQQHMKNSPWEGLFHVALYSFGTGFLLSRRRRRSERKKA